MAHSARPNAPGEEYGRAATWRLGDIALASMKVVSRTVALREPNEHLRPEGTQYRNANKQSLKYAWQGELDLRYNSSDCKIFIESNRGLGG
ncbi:hypothetical protein ABIF96_005929 [Bradyrhizobium ottawaense]